MPDPVLYLKAMCAALGASAIIVLALGRFRRNTSLPTLNLAAVLGITVGITLGYLTLGMRPVWPPINALARWWLIIFPAVAVIELVAGISRVPHWLAWCLRILLALLAGRILLHNSAYISGANSDWSIPFATMVLSGVGLLLAVEWMLLVRLAARSPGTSVPLSLAIVIQCAGIAIMLAGYVSGGAAAIPIAASVASAAIVAGLIQQPASHVGAISIGTVSLFSLLFIGCFFGNISTGSAIALMLSPLLCWITELPALRHRNRWLVGSIRLGLVILPLAIVLALATLKFQRETLPLL